MPIKKEVRNSYVTELIELLRPHSSGLSRHLVLSQLRKSRKSQGLSIPDTFEETVQSSFNQHCIQSEVFRSRNAPEDGFFCSKHYDNTATWVVDADLADAWLRTRSPHYELAQAIGRVKDISTEIALAAVEKADDQQRKRWRSHPRVKAALAQIRLEEAEKAIEREDHKPID